MDDPQPLFSNREIATAIWIGVFLVWALAIKGVRESIGGVFKAFFVGPIVRTFSLAAAFTSLVVFGLWSVGIWSPDNLKTTVLWYLTFASVTIFEAANAGKQSVYFSKIAKDIFNVTAIFVFIVQLHSFSLITELLMLPVLTFLGLLYEVSKHRAEHKQAEIFLGWVTAIIGFGIFAYALHQTIIQFEKVWTVRNALEFGIPLILSVAFLPFLYVLTLYIFYENQFVRLFYSLPDKSLRRYAKRLAIWHANVDLDFLNRWSRKMMQERPESRAAIRQSFDEIEQLKENERDPSTVAERDGWSPYDARTYLTEFGIEPNDWHESYGEWISQSLTIKFGEGFMCNYVVYTITGDEDAAKHLGLKLYVNRGEDEAEARAWFSDLCNVLSAKSLADGLPEEAHPNINSLEPFEAEIPHGRIALERDEKADGFYIVRFSIRRPKADFTDTLS